MNESTRDESSISINQSLRPSVKSKVNLHVLFAKPVLTRQTRKPRQPASDKRRSWMPRKPLLCSINSCRSASNKTRTWANQTKIHNVAMAKHPNAASKFEATHETARHKANNPKTKAGTRSQRENLPESKRMTLESLMGCSGLTVIIQLRFVYPVRILAEANK